MHKTICPHEQVRRNWYLPYYITKGSQIYNFKRIKIIIVIIKKIQNLPQISSVQTCKIHSSTHNWTLQGCRVDIWDGPLPLLLILLSFMASLCFKLWWVPFYAFCVCVASGAYLSPPLQARHHIFPCYWWVGAYFLFLL